MTEMSCSVLEMEAFGSCSVFEMKALVCSLERKLSLPDKELFNLVPIGRFVAWIRRAFLFCSLHQSALPQALI